jgi:hypothetical protein
LAFLDPDTDQRVQLNPDPIRICELETQWENKRTLFLNCRKMEEGRDGMIKEENEDALSFTTDSFADEPRGEEEEELEDYTSLAFERDLEVNAKSYR